MPRDAEALSRDEILDSCELFDRGQISLGVLLVNLHRNLGQVTGLDRTGLSVELAYLDVVSELPEERRRFQALEHTRNIRKLLFRPE